MDLKKEILKEHSKAQADKIIRYVGYDVKKFDELVSVFLAGPYRVTQRAGWPLSYCVERHPELIIPHLKKILDHLKKTGIHDSVKRNTLRLLQFVEIPKRFHAAVASVCFQYLNDTKEPVAVRVFAMSVLCQIARSHPDLKQELKIIIEDNLPYASAAFISRGKKVLKAVDAK
jgi:hypothetical protein